MGNQLVAYKNGLAYQAFACIDIASHMLKKVDDLCFK